jgi:septum formation protein
VRFILASESPRRVDLLRMVGYDFVTRKSGFPEVVLNNPKKTVEANARGKALAVAEAKPDRVVLAADTIVYLPEERAILGQAADVGEVGQMLERLAGHVHEVYSGVAIARGEEVVIETVTTQVQMMRLSRAELSAYAETGEGVGKAGGYAIQGKAALFVEEIHGDYSNVVGLPLNTTYRLLEAFGVYWW